MIHDRRGLLARRAGATSIKLQYSHIAVMDEINAPNVKMFCRPDNI